jgi:hypothetical protein
MNLICKAATRHFWHLKFSSVEKKYAEQIPRVRSAGKVKLLLLQRREKVDSVRSRQDSEED